MVTQDSVIRLRSRLIGPGQPCFIIAEAGVNHNGDLETAKRLVDAAKTAGADAVKFQTFKAENVISPSAPKAEYQTRTTSSGESQLDMVKKLELPFAAFKELFDYCAWKKILFLSTPFDEESVDFLDSMGLELFKIPSGEINNFPFLKRIASKKKPVILSTGMSYLEEVAEAVRFLRQEGVPRMVLLHCVSNYPADPAHANLRAMHTMAREFDLSVGYSDHTLGIEIALAAVALGACVIEKHFTLDHSLPGPDHSCSLEPDVLARLVEGIRKVESSLGDGKKQPVETEYEVAKVARKSLVAQSLIPAGTKITPQVIACKRPGTGLPPASLYQVLGRLAKRDITEGTLLSLDMLE